MYPLKHVRDKSARSLLRYCKTINHPGWKWQDYNSFSRWSFSTDTLSIQGKYLIHLWCYKFLQISPAFLLTQGMLSIPSHSFCFPGVLYFQNESTEILWKCKQTSRGVITSIWASLVMAMLHVVFNKHQTQWEQFILALVSASSSNVWIMVKSIPTVSFNEQISFPIVSSDWSPPSRG